MEILLVDDNLGDVSLAREALNGTSPPTHLNVVSDGEEAMLFLRREGPYGAAPSPDVVVLALNLPGMGGCEVLREIRAEAQFRSLPVTVLTSSEASQDVLRAYHLRANCYIVKPTDRQDYISAIRQIHAFWGCVAILPPRN